MTTIQCPECNKTWEHHSLFRVKNPTHCSRMCRKLAHVAGSYRHITDKDGNFRGTVLLDHMGDAYEALEECHDMIRYLSGGDREKIHESWVKGHMARAVPDASPKQLTFASFWDEDR